MRRDAETTETRLETDSLGPVEVPSWAYFGAQTERARRNFPISGLVFPRRFLAALAMIKSEAANANASQGRLDPKLAQAIRQAAEEVVDGAHDAHFPVDVFQTGSGTSTNMNANEVIANRASEILGGEVGTKELVHPNDHVNASQSSNDTIPTALHVSAFAAMVEDLEPALVELATSLEGKAREFDDCIKIGRTHLQDAVPIRLGQEFSGYARQARNGLERLDAAKPRLAELALGGTAVGTGLNAPAEFAEQVIAGLAARTGHPFVPARNRFESLAARDAAVETSGALKTIAVSLTKIANDLRWLGSGPRCGIGEIVLPALQPGSSIMPGKVNPVVPEAVLMVAAKVMGNDATISFAGSTGNFELNVMMPVIAHDLLQSIEILANGSRLLARNCVDGLRADRDRCQSMVERSTAMVTALVPRLGYDEAASIAREAFDSGRTIREVLLEKEILSPEEVDEILDARRQTEVGR